jgi:hypothetical protein
MRARVYVVFSLSSRAQLLTNCYADHVYGFHLWTFTVRARSIHQAYFLAYSHVFAAGPRDVGIRRIELARRFRDPDDSECIIMAPYLEQRIAEAAA